MLPNLGALKGLFFGKKGMSHGTKFEYAETGSLPLPKSKEQQEMKC